MIVAFQNATEPCWLAFKVKHSMWVWGGVGPGVLAGLHHITATPYYHLKKKRALKWQTHKQWGTSTEGSDWRAILNSCAILKRHLTGAILMCDFQSQSQMILQNYSPKTVSEPLMHSSTKLRWPLTVGRNPAFSKSLLSSPDTALTHLKLCTSTNVSTWSPHWEILN